MKLGPDGSLCRITSSAKDLKNNVRIIKVPDSEPSYKLVVIRPNDKNEELSEKSDEVSSDDEMCDVKFSSKNIEKEEVLDAEINKPNETGRETIVRERNVREHNTFKRPREYSQRNNKRIPARRNNFYRNARKFQNNSVKKKKYNYSSQDFNSTPSHSGAYNASIQRPSNNISPWLCQPVRNTNYTVPQFKLVPYSEGGNSLLGPHPSCVPLIPEFHSNKQNDNYCHDQNLQYSPVTANFALNNPNSFIHNQNSAFSQMPPKYSSSNQTETIDQNYSYDDNYCGYNNQYPNERRLNNKKWHYNKHSRTYPNGRNKRQNDYRR